MQTLAVARHHSVAARPLAPKRRPARPLCSQHDDGRRNPVHRAPPAPHAAGDDRQQAAREQAPHGTAGVDRLAAAQREIMEMKEEKADQRDLTASDDEWQHMPVQKKWWMELKALLYSWLGTGVEPL